MSNTKYHGSFAIKSLIIALGLVTLPQTGVAASTLTSAITSGKVSGNLRLRYEEVGDDAVARDGEALTLRTRIAYETAPFEGLSAVVEFEDVHTLFGVDDYAPESAGYATIADPADTELNRGYLRYRGISRLELGYGRQRLNFDNQRFVGSVGWRQDDQTFDGFTAIYTGIPDVTFNYAHLTKVNGITPQFDSSGIKDNLLNISYNGFSWGRFTGYAYLLDHQDEKDATVNAGLRFNTSDVVGLRFEGGHGLQTVRPVRILYAAEFARQDFETTAGVDRDADYSFLEGGVNVGLAKAAVTVKLAREVLGSDDGLYGFQTPYATKHAFNGWADKFLVTPAVGLEDTFATLVVAMPQHATTITAQYHQYGADEGSGDFGSEWGLMVAKVLSPNWTLGAKYSAYSGEDAPFQDTDKLWLWAELNF